MPRLEGHRAATPSAGFLWPRGLVGGVVVLVSLTDELLVRLLPPGESGAASVVKSLAADWIYSLVAMTGYNMQNKYFSGKVQELIDRANRGTKEDVDYILGHLTADVTLSVTKFVDYALSHVESDVGMERIEFYLFSGTQIQRNYCALFSNRRGDWPVVKKAYERGLIDEIQAYAR